MPSPTEATRPFSPRRRREAIVVHPPRQALQQPGFSRHGRSASAKKLSSSRRLAISTHEPAMMHTPALSMASSANSGASARPASLPSVWVKAARRASSSGYALTTLMLAPGSRRAARSASSLSGAWASSSLRARSASFASSSGPASRSSRRVAKRAAMAIACRSRASSSSLRSRASRASRRLRSSAISASRAARRRARSAAMSSSSRALPPSRSLSTSARCVWYSLFNASASRRTASASAIVFAVLGPPRLDHRQHRAIEKALQQPHQHQEVERFEGEGRPVEFHGAPTSAGIRAADCGTAR